MEYKLLNTPYPYFLLDAKLSQRIDERTINEMGIDGFTLMEIAGSSAAKELLSRDFKLSHGVYLCGKGNNGGDALVVARYLVQHDISATVVFLSGINDLSKDAGKNLELLKQISDDSQLSVCTGWDEFDGQSGFDFIIDGMLGTGLDSEVRKDYASAVEWANQQSVPIFSMDIPTGLHADTGQSLGATIKASLTFAFGGHKLGYYLNDGPDQTGQIHYCELPFPNSYKDECKNYLIDSSWIGKPSRTTGEHKYDSGVLYIIAGSEGLTGAGILTAKSAWAEGLGAVILVCPRGILPVYEQNLPAIIKKPVGSREDYFFKAAHISSVLDIVQEKPGTVLLGPGLGRQDETVQFANNFLAQNTANTLIDADALWALAQNSEWDKPDSSNWILTPHPGELSRLTNESAKNDYKRLESVRKLSEGRNITVLSKGMPGIIGTLDGKCYITGYDTRPFARAGSGDVLAGKVAAYWASDNPAPESCIFGLLNGKEKLDAFILQNKDILEPADFI